MRAAPVEESGSPPWSQGYEPAEEVHERFDSAFEQDDGVDMEGLIESLGVRIGTLELSDADVRGASIAGPQHRLGILVNARHGSNESEAGYRFTLAHELRHLLFDRERGQTLAVASGPWAPLVIEQRTNAFAAMSLMPTPLVEDFCNIIPMKNGMP